MKRSICLLFVVLIGSLHATIWVDEATLKESIQSSSNVQSKVIYARSLLEHDNAEEALDVLKGVDVSKNESVVNLMKDIQYWKRDKAYLKELNIDSAGSNVGSVASGLSSQDAEKLYGALNRFHIPIDVPAQRILGNKIGEGPNKILAGSILTQISKELLPEELTIKSQNIVKTADISDKKAQRVFEVTTQQPIKAKTKSLDEKLSDALDEYRKDSSMKNIEVISYLYTQMDKPEEQMSFLKHHVENYPFDYEVRLLLGKNLGWQKRYDEALDYLHMVEGNHKYDAKLASGQILSWKGDYSGAMPLLDEVIRFGNDIQRYDAKKSLAYIARWKGDHSTAKELFIVLNHERPGDEEVREEVLYDKKHFAPLINKYEALQKKSPQDIKIIQRLSSLLIQDGQEQKALYYFEKQYAITQDPNLLKEMGNIALRSKESAIGLNYWKAYAIKVDTAYAWLEYAKNLMWTDHPNEALVILKKIKNDSDVSLEVKTLIEEIKPASSVNVNSLTSAPSPESFPVSSDTAYKEESDYAVFLRKKGKFDEAARIYRSLYLKTSIPMYGQLYVQTLKESSNHEEAEAIAAVLMIESVSKNDEVNNTTATAIEEPLFHENKISLNIGLEGEQLTDSDGLQVTSAKVVGKLTTSNGVSLQGTAGGYKLSKNTEYMQGKSGFFSVGNDSLEAGVYVDGIDEKADFNPYLRFSYPMESHTLTLTGYRRNVGLVKNAIAPLKKHNTLSSLQLSDYALFSDNDEFWGAAEVAWDEEGNVIFTPQFQYRFYQTPIFSGLWSVAVDGWYIFNSKPTVDYYSPKFADGTFITNYLDMPMYENTMLKFMGGFGYSYESNVYLYKFGGWIEKPFSKGITFRLGCFNNKSIGAAGKIVPYSYDTCDAKLLLNW